MISSACSQLIIRGAAYGPLYGDDLSNHLPMALIALDRMGASPARLQAFYEHYSPRLRRRAISAPSAEPIKSMDVPNSGLAVPSEPTRSMDVPSSSILTAMDVLSGPSSVLEPPVESIESMGVLEPRLPSTPVPAAPIDPAKSMGVLRDFEGVLAYFRERLAEEGKEVVLRRWVSRLMPGVATGAFHSMIRLAYAIDAYDESEMAFGLASWVTEYQSLGDIGGLTHRTLDEIVEDGRRAVAQHRFPANLIVDRMVDVARLPAIRDAATQPDHLQFEDVPNFAIRMYAGREDFTVLHMVTGCHAFRAMLPYLQDPETAVRYLWHAVLIAYLSTGLAPERVQATPDATDLDWPRCLAKAVESDNDHVIKLVYTAWREAAITNDPLYLYVARRLAFGAA